jgi:hypothetical protein
MSGQQPVAKGDEGRDADPAACVFGQEQVEALPPEGRQAVLKFVAFVLERRRQRAEPGTRRLE